jgi:hypothetical protein
MLSRIVKVTLISPLILVTAVATRADGPGGVPSLLPAERAVRDAASLRDPAEREAALREAIRKGLLESEPKVANEVLGYLGDQMRWLDLRPFEDLLTEYGRIDPLHYRATWLLDQAELFRTPRDERLRIYSAAIVEGRTTLKHGRPLPRQSAMLLASDDGLIELKPLIETYYPEEPADVRSGLPLPELLTRLDLGAGASDREDANRLASERVAAMKDTEFRDRMNTDEAFRKVVDQIATYVCAIDGFAPRRNPGCTSIKDVVKRQLQLEKTTEEAARAATTTSTSTSTSIRQRYEERRDSWLGRMQASSAGEPSVQRPH